MEHGGGGDVTQKVIDLSLYGVSQQVPYTHIEEVVAQQTTSKVRSTLEQGQQRSFFRKVLAEYPPPPHLKTLKKMTSLDHFI